MEEQGEGSKQVLHGVSSLNEMATGIDQVNVAVNNVNEMTVKNRDAIDVLLKEVSCFKVE
jgi:methyl-accepting chemotaxis protein